MIIIFGSKGYMGSAIVKECERRGVEWRPGRRDGIIQVLEQISSSAIDLVINAAAFIPLPSVDACKDNQDSTIAGNVWWPGVLRDACEVAKKPIMHLSTGCLFDEQKEYTETDTPTRGWAGYCGFYVGTKLLSERVVSHYEKHYIMRLRLPFDEVDNPRNYPTKLMKYTRIFDHLNSLTHRADFARWALDLWEKRGPFGTYHCVNTGQISAVDLVNKLAAKGLMPETYQITHSPDTTGARLSNAKLSSIIGPIRGVEDAVNEAIANWKLCTEK